MTKVTYLLGAGASYDAVAINREISERVNEFLENGPWQSLNYESHKTETRITRNIDKFISAKNVVSDQYIEYLLPFFKDLEWLYEKTKRLISVDQYAKILEENNEIDDLKKFKYILSSFITIEQVLIPPDNRYSSFLPKIRSLQTFNDITVLTWNYDFQFEIANSSYSGTGHLYSNAKDLNIVTKNIHRSYRDGFSILKLNGNAGINDRGTRNGYILDDINEKPLSSLFDAILKGYRDTLISKESSMTPTLSFAWEHDSKTKQSGKSIIDYAREKIEESTHIIFIGYSFPDFNANIDDQLFGGVDYTGRQLFVQDPSSDKVIDKLREITTYRSNLKVKIKDPEEDFFIPREILA